VAGANESQVWKYLFNKYFRPPHDHFITFVVDGIDNMVDTQRRVFYRLIKHVVQTFKENGDGPIRFICLSQPTLKDEVAKAFASHFEMPSITITKEKNLRDIETYVSWIVDQSTKLRRALKDKTFRQETVKKLASCTEGIFESKLFSRNISGGLLIVTSGCFTVEATCTKGSRRFILRSP
jgi:hypothetical protein